MSLRIDGKAIAERLLSDLARTIQDEKLHPALQVFQVGDNPVTESYIRQKSKAAERIGASTRVKIFPVDTAPSVLVAAIQQANEDGAIHGLILQRPLPPELTATYVVNSVTKEKDIDGFVPGSPFTPPIGNAILTILKQVYSLPDTEDGQRELVQQVSSQHVVVVGKGETGGTPITRTLHTLGIPVTVVDSRTDKPQKMYKQADILISCTGKVGLIRSDSVHQGVVLLSVGISRGKDGNLHGDYEEHDIKDSALAYTPTPGGVGPVNVACLMQNLVEANRMARKK